MYHDYTFDSEEGKRRDGLAERILKGEVFVVRNALQHFDLMGMWQEAALRGVAKSVGQEAADRARRDGFHRIHEWVSAGDIPRMTDAVYDEIEPTAQAFLDRFMAGAFPGITRFYYERTPNVRFHIPYDIAQAHKKEFNKFAKDHGQGKIAAHGPHRDSWLDCPSNGLNLWFALGRIKAGNGLTIYPENYEGEYKFKRSGDIADGQKLNKTWTFDLEPGDVIMFHTDHVHGSELNRTNETRFAISCRLSVEKPHFPNLHYHPYVQSNWNRSSLLKPLAMVPAMMQPSYLKSLALRTRNKLVPSMAPSEPVVPEPEAIGTRKGDLIEVKLSDVPVGTIRGVTSALMVARPAESTVVALTRRCPHSGGDIANGWIDGDAVVCPWHNLPFKSETGASNCKTVARLKRVACEIRGDLIVIDPKKVIAGDGAEAMSTAAE